MLGGVGIHELNDTRVEGIRGQRLPDRVGQIGGGFNHNIQVRRPGNREVKADGLVRKEAAVPQDPGIGAFPHSRWIARRIPSLGPRKIIESCG